MKNILYFILLIPAFISAQINESDTLNIKAGLSLTGFWQAGNVETVIFRAKTDLSFVPLKNWVFKNQNSYVYQEFGKNKADEDRLSLNFLYLNPDRKVYPFVLAFFSTNYRREIELRYLTGAGVSFNVFREELYWLKFSLSSEYEKTAFNNTDFHRDEYDGQEFISTFRTTLWLNGKYHLFNKRLVLGHESYIQPSLDDKNNYRWQADLNLELPIWDFLNFKVNYRHTFESIVVEDQKQADQELTFGFSIKSYK